LTVVGQGIEHAALVETIERVFEGIQLTPQSKTTSAKYFGGDIHLDVPAAVASGNAVCAVAFPTTTAERSAARALRHLLGGESRLKWAQGQSPLAKAAQAHNAEVQGLNLEYSDAGLLGFIVHAPAGKIRSAVRDLAAELKKVASGDVSAEALKRAISTARFEAANAVENVDARLAKLGNDIATTGASVSLTDSIADIASIQSANVVDLAKRLVASRPTLAAAGNQHDLPYADELGL
jgi:ubiquinol-cytochrome c reductase core subunit 2